MIDSVRKYLSLFGEVDNRILNAMKQVNRKAFVKNPEQAYIDYAFEIGRGQTISQPSTVARMLSLLELEKKDNVLEIGTGSGWNAALIANLVKPGKVVSLEILDELVDFSKKNLKRAHSKKVEVLKKDFRELSEKFDKIMFTAGIEKNQEKIIENYTRGHLKDGGILICPYIEGPIIIFKKISSKLTKKLTSESYIFVPLVLDRLQKNF